MLVHEDVHINDVSYGIFEVCEYIAVLIREIAITRKITRTQVRDWGMAWLDPTDYGVFFIQLMYMGDGMALLK